MTDFAMGACLGAAGLAAVLLMLWLALRTFRTGAMLEESGQYALAGAVVQAHKCLMDWSKSIQLAVDDEEEALYDAVSLVFKELLTVLAEPWKSEKKARCLAEVVVNTHKGSIDLKERLNQFAGRFANRPPSGSADKWLIMHAQALVRTDFASRQVSHDELFKQYLSALKVLLQSCTGTAEKALLAEVVEKLDGGSSAAA